MATEKNGILSQGFMHIISATKDMTVIMCTVSQFACHVSKPLGLSGVFRFPFCGLRPYESACPNGREAMHQKTGAVR